jgi:cytochrome c553
MQWTLRIGWLTGVVLASSAALAQTPQLTLEAQVAEALQTCFQCHGENGVSTVPTRPTIAGQNADYVVHQLHAFKRAAEEHARTVDSAADADAQGVAVLQGRSDPIMEHMAAGLDDALVMPVAEAVAKLTCNGEAVSQEAKIIPTNPPQMPAVGQRCVACHGVDGIGVQPTVPNIAGQQRAYLRRQLLMIRETAWGAQPREHDSWRGHPIMESQAARISIEDLDALAHYYSTLDCRGATVGAR